MFTNELVYINKKSEVLHMYGTTGTMMEIPYEVIYLKLCTHIDYTLSLSFFVSLLEKCFNLFNTCIP